MGVPGDRAGLIGSSPGLTAPLQRVRAYVSAGVALLGLAALAPAAAAQAVQGRVVDDETGAGIPGARVVVRAGDAPAIAARAVAGIDGTFYLPVDSAGEYRLEATDPGYAAMEAVPVTIGTGEAVEVDVRLARVVMALDPLTVVGRRRDPRLDATLEGALARHAAFPAVGSRRVALHTDIELLSSLEVSDVLRHFPAQGCRVLFVDGRLAATPETMDMWLETAAVHLAAVEFYRDMRDAPEDYRRLPPWAPSYDQCSVLAMWHAPLDDDDRRGWMRLVGAAAALLVLVVIL